MKKLNLAQERIFDDVRRKPVIGSIYQRKKVVVTNIGDAVLFQGFAEIAEVCAFAAARRTGQNKNSFSSRFDFSNKT